MGDPGEHTRTAVALVTAALAHQRSHANADALMLSKLANESVSGPVLAIVAMMAAGLLDKTENPDEALRLLAIRSFE